MRTEETLARVILRPTGKVYIALRDAQAIYATPENIMLFFSDPMHFLDNASAYEDVGIEINRNRVVLDEVLGLTLASVTSDKRIICDFPELFHYILMAEEDRTQPLDMSSFRFETFLSDEKSYLLRYYLDFMNNIPPSLTIERNIKLRNEVQNEIIREILNSFFDDNLPTPKAKKDVFEQIASAESALMYAAEEKSVMVTATEYAKKIGCSVETVRKYARAKRLKSAIKTPEGHFLIDINDKVIEWDLKKNRKRKNKPSSSGKYAKRKIGASAAEVEAHILQKGIFTKAIAPYIHTFEEMTYYVEKSYHEVCWDGQPALIVDVNPDYKAKNGEKNRDRMIKGDPPHIPDSLKDESVYDIHHIGQNSSSPFAIIPSYEHNGKLSSFLHAGKPNKDLHGPEFDAQKSMFWKNYIKAYDAAGEYKRIEYLNPKSKRGK